MSNQLGIAIVGCGYWGMNYVRLFNDLPTTRVVAVCDQNPERLQETEKHFNGIPRVTDVEELLHIGGIDAAVVCTNAAAHYHVTRRLLQEKKHVLVEKPMATTAANAARLVDLAASMGVTLMVGHIFLYNSGIQKIKSCIEQHELGDIYYLYARRTNLGPIRSDVNALWDLAPHDISISNYLLAQRPEWVSAVGNKVLHNHREDVGFIILGYANNVLGHVHVSWAEPNKVRELVVVGSDKRIVFNDLDPLERVRIFEKGIAPSPENGHPTNFGEFHFSIRDGDIISPKIAVSEPLKNQCNHFIDCILNHQTPLSDAVNGLEVVQIMEAASRSVAQRGAPVELRWDIPVEQMAAIDTTKGYDYVYKPSTVH